MSHILFRAGTKILIIIVSFLLLSVQGCSPAEKPRGEELNNRDTHIRITALGDFLMHMPVVNAAYEPERSGYNFRKMFSEVENQLSGADFTLANLETRLAGPAKGYSGYPRFNSPSELAGDMKALGIDMVTTANNHSMDMGPDGIAATLDNLDRAGLLHTGTYRSGEESEKPFTVDIKGIRVGFLNYTQNTNGIPVPSESPFMVNLIERERIAKDINLLKKETPDLIIACMHFGTEYQQKPNEFQKTLVKELFQQGVDAVLGCHVHVVQPMETQTITAGGKQKNCFVIYSLGNFISNQRWRHSDCGIILNLDIHKTAEGETAIEKASYIPVWVHTYRENNRLNFRVLPVDEAIKNYEAGKDSLLNKNDYQRLQQVKQDIAEVMGPPVEF
ncbi:capsule biosynthesis protein capA [Desulfocucumis palustris]|uniref:Capsule biosynthesis protein capA n=1 Tax=Desulfocucumis palustris TaxID=1898651 RepID=A0A2L2XG08_9FIRM|nr:CapA family protein [Desulfocucumis palustris]GBF32811.1 capsule biosynthesis protein capA [Desulfocucumis palustris]